MEDILLAATAQPGSLYFLGLFQPLLKLWTKTKNYLNYSEPQVLLPTPDQPLQCNKGQDETLLGKEEVKMVMGRLGLCYEDEGDDVITNEDMVGAELVSRVFNEAEPSLEEVKEAFDVFDENRDGLIGAADLQRVLCNLGLKGKFGLEECQRMIKAVDMNQDGLVDFEEFVKHMDNCF
ncbi:probable calcium-binding protein CML46 [Rosa rugosa]|uniref:probable calcium-binding protein CML46 n=1 Tax=Rosa rugosa TaxID=74645 RepID=UPI002B4052B4|nr:probable calcium-binding protein CML46 [Rosa rugosa]